MSQGFAVLIVIAAVGWVAWREGKSRRLSRTIRRTRLLLAVALGFPLGLAAQRVEIGVFGGWFQQTPETRTETFTDGASIESMRNGGGTFGAHVGVLGRRFGMSLQVLQARSMTSDMTFTDATGVLHQVHGSLEFKSTFFVLQPLVRLPVSGLEANVALGPSFTDTDGRGAVRLGEPPPASDEDFQSVDEWWSIALSAALRAHLGSNAVLEFRGSNMYRLGSDQEGNRNHWIVGVGLAWALKRE